MKQIRKPNPPTACATPAGTWRRHAVRVLALWVLLLAAYSNSFQAAPVFDSSKILTQDTRIRAATSQNLRLILDQEYWYGGAPSGLYRPLTTLSYLLNYSILGNGVNPAGYHWMNFALQALNVALVYGLGLLIFTDPALALALAALWGVHPLLTDSVTNIVGRADLLAAFGVLAGLLCYVKGASATERHRWMWLTALAVSQAIGLFSKENAAVLPGLMLLYDWTWPTQAPWRRRLPAYACLAAPLAIFFYLRSSVHTHMLIPFAENPLVSASFWTARLTAVKVIGKLAWLVLWPARLSADYSYNAVPIFAWRPGWEDAQTVLALAGCVAAGVAAVRWRRARKPLCFFLLFWFLALLPTANLVMTIGSIMAERFAYLASVGLVGCLVAAIYGLSRRTASIIIALACLALAARTYARNIDWADERSFWASTVSVCPDAARPHNNLGNALAQIDGHLPEAIPEFRAALRIRPEYVDAHYNLANALAQSPATLDDAIAEYQSALRIEPGFAQAHVNLGTALMQIPGHIPDAVAQFEAAVRSDPSLADARYDLATTLAQMDGRVPDAIAEFQALLRLDPNYARAHNNLGSLFAQIPGRLPDAIAEFQAALRIQPDYAKARENLESAQAALRAKR